MESQAAGNHGVSTPEFSLDTIDIISPDYYQKNGYPHAEWTYLRKHHPVCYIDRPRMDPFWAITKAADLKEISVQPRLWLNGPRLSVFMLDEGDSGRILYVPLHSQAQRLKPLEKKEGIEGRDRGADVAQVLQTRLQYEACREELGREFREYEPVITGVRLGERGKSSACFVLERAPIDERLTEGVVLLGRAVAPVDLVRRGQRGDLLDPGQQALVLGGGGSGGVHGMQTAPMCR